MLKLKECLRDVNFYKKNRRKFGKYCEWKK